MSYGVWSAAPGRPVTRVSTGAGMQSIWKKGNGDINNIFMLKF